MGILTRLSNLFKSGKSNDRDSEELASLFDSGDSNDLASEDAPSERKTTASWKSLRSLNAAGRAEFLEGFLQRTAAHMAEGGATGETQYNSNDDEAQWRGTCYGLPLRLKAESDGTLEGMVKFTNHHGSVSLSHDPKYVQQPGDGEAFDPTDRVRIFVGRGVVIEIFAIGLEAELTGFQALPEGPRDQLVASIPGHGLSHCHIRSNRLEWKYLNRARGTKAQEESFARFALLACWAASTWANTPPNPELRAAHEAASNGGDMSVTNRVKCSYCGATFLLTGHAVCSNCGAPAKL